MGLEASHFTGEISMEIYIMIISWYYVLFSGLEYIRKNNNKTHTHKKKITCQYMKDLGNQFSASKSTWWFPVTSSQSESVSHVWSNSNGSQWDCNTSPRLMLCWFSAKALAFCGKSIYVNIWLVNPHIYYSNTSKINLYLTYIYNDIGGKWSWS